MTLPNFVVIGALKSGTSSLCHQLSMHPDVYMSNPKELDFFNRNYEKGLSWYTQFFSGHAGEKAVGEGSVLYAMDALFPKVPARMARHLPDARLLYMVRHPLDRIESQWCQHVSNGDRVPAFCQAVREWRPLLDASLYQHQLDGFLRFFPRERVKVLFLEQYRADPGGVLKECFRFLDVDPLVSIPRPDARLNDRSILPMDGLFWTRMRHTGLGVLLRRYLGEGPKKFLRPLVRTALNVVPAWDKETIEWALRLIRQDAQSFLAAAGVDRQLWDLGDTIVRQKLEEAHRLASRPVRKKPFVLSALDFHGEKPSSK